MIFKIFLFWRIGLLVVTYIGTSVIPKVDNGGIGSIGPGREFDYWASWAQWDGGHYFQIAKQGYIFLSDYAFFPLFPTLIKIINMPFNNLLFAGLLVSNISFFAFLFFFYKLINKKYGHNVAITTIGTYLTFPTAFFAASYYSESLFLLLTVITFYFISEKRFLIAGIAASLSSVTRLAGVSLVICIFYAYFASLQMNIRKVNQKILHLAPSIFGISIYCIYLFSKLDDPLKFITSQNLWERTVTDPISTVLSYLWAIITLEKRPFNDYLDLILTLLFLSVLVLGIKKISSSLWIFSILVILIPASTGTLTSMPRYLLSSLGVFIILGKYLSVRPRLKVIIWAISLFAQSILAVRFINGYWVA